MALNAPPPTAAERAEVGALAGLCASCRHLLVLRSRRSAFVRCGRAADDPRFARYPPLPVAFCGGYEGQEEEDDPQGPQ